MNNIRNFRQIQSKLAAKIADQRGATVLEYGLFVFGIGTVLAVSAFTMGDEIKHVLENLDGFLSMRNESVASLFGGGIESE